MNATVTYLSPEEEVWWMVHVKYGLKKKFLSTWNYWDQIKSIEDNDLSGLFITSKCTLIFPPIISFWHWIRNTNVNLILKRKALGWERRRLTWHPVLVPTSSKLYVRVSSCNNNNKNHETRILELGQSLTLPFRENHHLLMNIFPRKSRPLGPQTELLMWT